MPTICFECKQPWGTDHKDWCSKPKNKIEGGGVSLSISKVDHTDSLPDKDAEVLRAAMAHMARERFLESCCTECLKTGKEVVMSYICTLAEGDEEARGSTGLYQCSACKTVVEKY
jgi:hypothetical protein